MLSLCVSLLVSPQLHQALNDARVKMVQADEAFLAATARLDADLQQAAKREETARTVLTEEVRSFNLSTPILDQPEHPYFTAKA